MATVADLSGEVTSSNLNTGFQERPWERNVNIDVIRATAMCMVVVLHVAASLAYGFNTLDRGSWWASNILDSLTRAAMPLFFIVSGFLLLDPSRDQRVTVFFQRRLSRVVVPFIAWLVIYLFWNTYAYGHSYTLASALQAMIAGPVYFHLWFMYSLLGLYLATPILRLYTRFATARNLVYFLVLWAIAVAIIPLLSRFFNLNVGVSFVVMTGFSGFFVAGPLMRQMKITPYQRGLLTAVFLASAVFTMVSTYVLTVDAGGQLDEYFYQYTSVNVILMAFSAFLALNSIPFERFLSKHNRLKAIVVGISARTLGIYFVHVIVLELLQYQTVVPQFGAGFISAVVVILALSVVCIGISTSIIAIMERIPIIRWIV